MPTYDVTAPDGKQFEISGDHEPSESELKDIWEHLPASPKTEPKQTDKIETASSQVKLDPYQKSYLETGLKDPSSQGESDLLTSLARDIVPPVKSAIDTTLNNPITKGLGIAFDTSGKVIGTGAKVLADLATGNPDLAKEEIPALLDNLQGAYSGQEPRLSPWEEGRKSLPLVPRAAAGAGMGLIESSPRLAIAAMQPEIGAASFGLTKEGFDPVVAGAMMIAPVGGKILGNIISKAAAKAGVESKTILSAIDRVGGAAGVAGLMSAPSVYQIAQMPKGEERNSAIEDTAANAILIGVLGAIGKRSQTVLEPRVESQIQAVDRNITPIAKATGEALKATLIVGENKIANPELATGKPTIEGESERPQQPTEPIETKSESGVKPEVDKASKLQALKVMQQTGEITLNQQKELASLESESTSNNSREAFQRAQDEADSKKSPTPDAVVSNEKPVGEIQTAPEGTVVRPINNPRASYTKRNGDWWYRPNQASSEFKVDDPDIIKAVEKHGNPTPDLTEVLADEVLPPEQKQTSDTQKNLARLLAKSFQRDLDESRGQHILDYMDENGIKPSDTVEKFWSETYPNLTPEAQKRFHKMIEGVTGFKIGDVIATQNGKKIYGNSYQELYSPRDAADSVTHLEGTERGLIALMETGNQNFAKSKTALTESKKQLPNTVKSTSVQTESIQKYKVGNNPQLHSVVEKLPASEIEILNGEQPIKIKNEKTGDESIVLEIDLKPVSERTPEQRAASKINKTTIDENLKSAGLEPSAFNNISQKREALKRARSKSDAVDSTLSKWIDDLSIKGDAAFSDPFFIQSVGKPAVRGALIAIRAGYRAGKTFYEAIEDGIQYLRVNNHKFDEKQARTWFEENVKIETDQTSEAKVFPTEGQNVEMRKSAARAAKAESFPEDIRKKIESDPNSFYTQQSINEVSGLVGKMSDGELSGVPRDSNLYVAAKLEQANRLFNQGKNDDGYSVFVELEKEGTRLGQLINQFKLLQGVSPTSIANVVDASLKRSGKDLLTKEQRDRLIGLSQQSIELNRSLEVEKNNWLKSPTEENAVKADEALESANKSDIAVQVFVHRFQPKSIAGTLKTILQGNLLTPISEVANVVGNVSFLPFRAMTRTLASGFDVLDNYLTGHQRETTVQPVLGTVEAAKGLVRGLKQIPSILKRGSGDVLKGERSVGLHPLRAWVNQFSKNPELPTTQGKITLSDRVRLAIEGTFGIPAETMLRGLAAGDVPFRNAAQSRIIATELRIKKVPQKDWPMAQKFPELFFDRATLEKINEETAAAIFQRKSKTINNIINILSSKGEWADLAATTVAPYKLTPWNVISEILSYNPLVAVARTVLSAKKGNRLETKTNASKFMVGSLLTASGYWLYENGLIAPSMDSRDEQQKARLLAGEVLPPNHINITGLERKLAGGDAAFQKGDKTYDMFRAGGLAGSMFYMVSNIGRDLEKSPITDDSILWSLIKNSTIEQMRFGMNQSFLQGVGGLMEAVKSGNTDGYVKSWENTVLSIPLPNTLTALSRATRPYKIEVNSLPDLIKSRIGVLGFDDSMTVKRGLWGEPLRETPENRNALIYHLFDVTKNKTTTDDPVAIELYKLWRRTADTSIIPTPPTKSLTVKGETYDLDVSQLSRLSELVGQYRKQLADDAISGGTFQDLEDEEKVKVLKKIYEKGMKQGKDDFMDEQEDGLKLKAKKSGFK